MSTTLPVKEKQLLEKQTKEKKTSHCTATRSLMFWKQQIAIHMRHSEQHKLIWWQAGRVKSISCWTKQRWIGNCDSDGRMGVSNDNYLVWAAEPESRLKAANRVVCEAISMIWKKHNSSGLAQTKRICLLRRSSIRCWPRGSDKNNNNPSKTFKMKVCGLHATT